MVEQAFRIVIGLEVHVQLMTKTKLFCGCSTKFGQLPNTATCPVCTGQPGALPVMNREAYRLAVRGGLALNCSIANFTKWDRKNYYYPDLPKNYQISQYDLPLSHDGHLEITTEASTKKVGIIRAHLEEDAGKMLHDEQGAGRDSQVDLNRTGTPLLEIVSQPEMESADEAKAYLEAIRLLLRELEISDCEMQEGSLRCDANVNLHVPQPDGSMLATPLIEIKNLNSIRGVEKAIKYETDRQFAELQENLASKSWRLDHERQHAFRDYRVSPVIERKANGTWDPVSKATAGWNDRLNRTEIQRRKEEAADYRYFPDPDLVPATIDQATIDRLRAELGELPAAQFDRLQSQYGLSEYDAGVLSRQGRALVAYYEQVVKSGGDAKEACNWVTNELLQTLNEKNLDIKQSPISAERLGELIREAKSTIPNKQRAREVYAEMLTNGTSVKEAIQKLGLASIDESKLLEIIQQAIASNPKAVADFKNGKTKAADAIKGAVMKQTKGMARTDLVQQLLLQELQK